MRRTILFLITLLATATLWPVSAWAYTGTGTADAPYLVDNWADLKTCMAAGGYIQLTGNCTDPNPTNLTYLSVPANKTVTLDLNGYMINRGLESDIYMGFVIVVSATGTLIIDDSYNGPFDSNHADRIHDISGGETINGGLITGGKNIRQTGYNYNVGGGINNLGTLILNKGTIAGNSTNEYGGGVYVAKDYNNSNPSNSNSSFTMNGGAILYNSSQIDGGGIYLSSGTFTMNGGTVGGNSSIDGNGGGIYHISGTLSLTGGTIENNTCNANKYGGGIYRNTNNTFNISGNPIVRNNKKGDLETGSTNNLCLNYDNYDNSKITVNGALSENAQIGIFIKKTNLDSRVFTTGLNTYGVSESFSSDDSNYTITTNNGEAKIITNWLYLKDRFSAGGDITLDRDYISQNSEDWLTVSSGKAVVLDLNGYKIDRNKSSAAASGSVINVYGTLTIKDTYPGTDRVHTITVNGESVDIVGGLITGGNSSGNYGGGITNAGTLILQSGTIAGNKADKGGGVFILQGKSFSMIGGNICYNYASNSGGGVYLHYNSTTYSSFSMNGGTIKNNIAKSSGGGFYTSSEGNTFEISGSPIITNNNTNNSGSIKDSNVNMIGGWKINVTGFLNSSALLGLSTLTGDRQQTNGLGEYGTESNFTFDRTDCLLRKINGEIWSMQPYTVTIADSENGSVSASATTAARYDVITITPHPDEGYYLATLSHNNGYTTTDFLESKQFTMGPYNYTINATFAPKTSITPTVSLANWVYGDAASTLIVEGNTGNGDVSCLYKVKDADDVTYTETVPTVVGTYTVKATIAESAQYLGAAAIADFTITKRPVTITSGITANNKTYDGTTAATIGTANAVFDGKIGTDELTVSTTGVFSDKNVGVGKTVTLGELTLGGTSMDNYELAASGHQTETTANITPLTLNVTADNATKTYGEDNPTFTLRYSGFLTGENETTALSTQPTATSTATISSNVGSYNIVPDGGVATNYTFNYVSGTLIINPKSLTEDMVTISDESKVYNGNSQKPTITLEDADANCTITDNDYNISNDGSGTNVGTYNVVIGGKNNYSGILTFNDCFEITPKSIAGVSITAVADQTYTGSAITPTTVITDTEISPTPTLTENTDYTLSYSTNNTNVTGENVTITVTGKGNYDSSTSTSTTFKIVPKALENGMISAIGDQTYTGSGIEPVLTVNYNDMSLTKGTDYTANFENNTSTSDAPTVTITACDNSNYSGTASASFNIVAADLSTAEVTGASKNVDFGSSTSPAIDPLTVNFPVADYKVEYRKTYQTGADVATIPTNAIGEYTVVLKPTDTGNLTGEKVTDYKVNVQLPINLKQCEWVTYFDERFDLATPTGYQAYKVSNASPTSVTAEAIDYIPKNVPVILKTTATGTSSSSMTVRFNEQQTTSDITGSTLFKGIPSTSEGVTPSGTSFILVGDKFVLYEGTDVIPAHRCYLTFGGAGTRSIGIDFGDGGATSISDPPNNPAFEEPGQWYDLQGRRIEKPTKKGMYIKDGQKVVITGKEARL